MKRKNYEEEGDVFFFYLLRYKTRYWVINSMHIVVHTNSTERNLHTFCVKDYTDIQL